MKRILVLLSLSLFAMATLSGCSDGDDGTNGLPGVSGTDGKSPIIQIVEATEEECPTGGKKYITGFDNETDGIVDIIITTSLACNEPENVMTTSACIVCHTKETASVKTSRHIEANTADSTSGHMSTETYCTPCHAPDNDFALISSDAKSGVSCMGCHEFNGKVKKNVVHSTYVAATESCASCHSDLTDHFIQGHFVPFSKNIAGEFGKAYDNVSAHGQLSARNTNACAVCHTGTFVQNIVMKEKPRTATATDSNAKVSVTGGASYFFTNQWSDRYDGKSKDNYSAMAAKLGVGFAGSDIATSRVGCDTCHEPHAVNNNALRTADYKVDAPVDGAVNHANGLTVFSAEFLLCTTCHLVNVDATRNAGNNYSGSKFYAYDYALSPKYVGAVDGTTKVLAGVDASFVGYHSATFETNASHSIIDSHFAGEIYSKYSVDGKDVMVDNATKKTVVGYGINAGDRNACSTCHNPHKGSIFQEARATDPATGKDAMAGSGLGEFIFEKLVQNFSQSGHNKATDVAFARETYSSSCNRCHNGRTFAYFALGDSSSNLNGDAFGNNAGHVGSPIGCATCHDFDNSTVAKNGKYYQIGKDNASASVREWNRDFTKLHGVNAYSATAAESVMPDWAQSKSKKVTDAGGTTADLAVLANAAIKASDYSKASMVCVYCHSGRDTGERIVESLAANGSYAVGKPTSERIISDYVHYMDAVGTINQNGPYNFDLTPIVKTAAHFGAEKGCTACHDVKEHTFKVYKDADGVATSDVASIANYIDPTSCAPACHNDAGVTSKAAKKGYDAALQQLMDRFEVLGVQHVYDTSDHSSVNKDGIYYGTYWVTKDSRTPFEAWNTLAGVNNGGTTSANATDIVGAAYNTHYFFYYDKGGYAHGTKYTKQILKKSMDVLGGTFTGDADAWFNNGH